MDERDVKDKRGQDERRSLKIKMLSPFETKMEYLREFSDQTLLQMWKEKKKNQSKQREKCV